MKYSFASLLHMCIRSADAGAPLGCTFFDPVEPPLRVRQRQQHLRLDTVVNKGCHPQRGQLGVAPALHAWGHREPPRALRPRCTGP